MLLAFLKVVTGLLLLMGLWLAVQAYLRSRLKLHPDADVLEDMTHGCGACGHGHGGCGGACESDLRHGKAHS